jgi:DNA-binding HxlR family transcriptional regulator
MRTTVGPQGSTDDACASHAVGECPVERTLNVIGRRWVGQVLWHLLSGRKRHGELLGAIGSISARMLTDRLRELEASGFVTREAFAEVPPRVEYELTERGRSLAGVFEAMWAWGLDDQRETVPGG